jgi:trigger factor
MKTQVSALADNRVRLEVEVPAADVDHAFDHALHDLAANVRVPGFRRGKAPKPLVMRQVGRETVVEEALRDHLTGWYTRAVAVAGIAPVARPTIDWSNEPAEGSPFAFTAEVEVKPPPEVRAYKGLEAVRQPVEVPEQAIDTEIERLRTTVAELNPVDRPAAQGDFVVIDYQSSVDGEPLEDGSGEAYGVELGAGKLLPELEQGIAGIPPGGEREIDVVIPDGDESQRLAGKQVRFHVTVKEVKERVLPALDDELAMSVSEFDTLGELRADIHERIREAIQRESDRRYRSAALAALGEQLTTPMPEPLVADRLSEMTRGLIGELRARGIEMDDYLRISGQTAEQLVAAMRPQAEDAVRKDLALEAVVAAEGIDVTDEMVESWVRDQATESEEDTDAAVARLMGDPAVLTALRTDLAMQKALDIVVENATPITPEKAEARDKLWTPEKESAAAGAKPSPIWTPGSAEPAKR